MTGYAPTTIPPRALRAFISRLATAALAAAALGLAGCGDDGGAPAADAATDAGPTDAGADSGADAGAPRDWPASEVPASTVPEEGVRRDIFTVAGATPPPNPSTGDATPERLDRTQVVRYRQDVDPPAEAHAVVVAMPGFLGGGPSFDALARALVRNAVADGTPIEVWAIDRRSNLLEDLRGMDAAEAEENPEIANGYYFGDETVGGEAFEGFLAQSDVPYMSEWGLATHARDLRAVIALVEEAERKARVFLMGHSLGASFTEAWAAWRFEDGTRGFDELAGIVLVDGVLGGEPITETEYREGTGSGAMMQPGLDAIREGNRFTALPLLGVAVQGRAEVLALRALLAPEAVQEDRGRDQVLQILLGLGAGQVPPLTNRAAFGLGFDEASTPVSFAASSLGEPTGGPLESFTSPFGGGMLQRPADPDATYSWVDAPDTDPPEYTPIANLATSYVHGRSNFGEWYFPSRLPLDLSAVAGASVPEDGWQADEGLRAFDGAEIDAPVLAIAAGLVSPDRFEAVRTRIAPTVGGGRPHAGDGRDVDGGFRVVDATFLTHIDPLSGADTEDNPVPEEVLGFVTEHAAEGTVQIPAM